MMRSVTKFFASLRLTVVCLAIGLVLVFLGTLAQVDEGLWNAQTRWFRSFFIWVGPAGAHWKVPVFPGGYLLGIVLLLNLVTAHVKRFQWSWRKLGIHLTHGGIVLLLLGQLLTDKLSRESLLSLREGETRAYSQSRTATELVFASDSDGAREKVVSIPGERLVTKAEISHPEVPFVVRVLKTEPNSEIFARSVINEAYGTLTTALATMEAEYASPEGLAAQAERALESEGRLKVWREALASVGEDGKGDLIAAAKRVAAQPARASSLLAELKKRFRETMLTRFARSSEMGMRMDEKMLAQGRLAARLLQGQPITPDTFQPVATRGVGLSAVVLDLPENKEMDKGNVPYAVVELLARGQSLGTWLLSPTLRPEEITADSRAFRVAYRFERYYQPFSLTLVKTTHDVYPGTVTSENPEGIPKNFQSRVRLVNAGTHESREVDIFMNNPLRYDGLTFYQYQMGADEAANGAALGTSTFQVVKNPGWLTPYFGCLIVGLGMLYQFLFHLIGFVGKRRNPARGPESQPAKKRRNEPAPQPV